MDHPEHQPGGFLIRAVQHVCGDGYDRGRHDQGNRSQVLFTAGSGFGIGAGIEQLMRGIKLDARVLDIIPKVADIGMGFAAIGDTGDTRIGDSIFLLKPLARPYVGCSLLRYL